MKTATFILTLIITLSCTTGKKIGGPVTIINTGIPGSYQSMTIEFFKGRSFNYPSFAIWVEDIEGNYIETLYVTQFVATGVFRHGEIESGKWKNESGEVRRPSSLPYWAHKRGIKSPDGLFIPSLSTAVPDALTSATPKGNFILNTGTTYSKSSKFRVLMEINQPWDSNKFWSNSKIPDNFDYFTSLQPALVYSATIDLTEGIKEYYMNPIGHSHPSGMDGKLYTDLSTLTTAKNIADKIVVKII